MSGVVNRGRRDHAEYLLQRSGPVLKGYGAPRDEAGSVGNVYVDLTTQQLYQKRFMAGIGQWGNWLLAVPPQFLPTLNWYSFGAPAFGLAKVGDFALVWDVGNFSAFPALFGPAGLDDRGNVVWPQVNEGPAVAADLTTLAFEAGLNSEIASAEQLDISPIIRVGLGSEVFGGTLNARKVTPLGLATTTGTVTGWPVNPNWNVLTSAGI